jgi:virginiamycin B lyase
MRRRHLRRAAVVLAVAASLTCLTGPVANAVDPGGAITEFPVTGSPVVVTAGADGNLWYSDLNGSVLRVTTDGEITQFPTPSPGGSAFGITAGADGNVWFSQLNQMTIARVTPAGVITEFPLPPSAPQPASIVTLGPDGNVWGIAGESFVKVAPDGTTTGYPGVPLSGTVSITAGPDGNLWFVEQGANKIGRMTTAGVIEEQFTIPTASSSPVDITRGPDGKLWFTEPAANQVASITTTGQITEFPASPDCHPSGIAADADGRLWVTCGGVANAIGVMTTDGAFRAFPIPAPDCQPTAITEGPDGNMWFAEFGARQVARVGTGPFPPVPPVPPAPAPPAVVAGTPTFTG